MTDFTHIKKILYCVKVVLCPNYARPVKEKKQCANILLKEHEILEIKLSNLKEGPIPSKTVYV